MTPRTIAAAIVSSLCLASAVAQADPPEPELVFVADPKLGMEGGVRTTLSLGHLLFDYEQALPRVLDVDEGRTFGRTMAVLGRGVKLALLDLPIASTEVVAIHEIFGHGARAREMGASPTYTFRLPEPYIAVLSPGQTDPLTAGDYGNVQLPANQDLIVRAGGVESGYVTAWWIDAGATAARGWVRHDDLLVYGASKVAYTSILFSSNLARPGLGTDTDLAAYVTDLQLRFGRLTGEDRAQIVRRLRDGFIWNVADPTLLFAVYGTIVDSLWNGRRYSRLPLPTLGGDVVYLAPRFGLSPFGAEHTLDAFVSHRSLLVDLYGRAGSSGLASYTGGGLRVLGWQPVRRLSVGAEIDAWSQPQAVPGLTVGVLGARRPSISDSLGANAGAFARVALLDRLGITAKLAYKSNGYLMGEPIGQGAYGYVGISFAP